MKRVAYIFFIITAISGVSYAQNKTMDVSIAASAKVDSLLTLLKKDKPDTTKVIHLNELCWEYLNIGNYAAVSQYGNAELQLAKQLNFPKGISLAYNNIGEIYEGQGSYSKALENYFTALKTGEEAGDKKGIANSHNNIGNIYNAQDNYEKALENYFASLKIWKETGDKNAISDLYNNIGIIYTAQGNYDKALENYLVSLKIKEQISNKQGIAILQNNIGEVYEKKGKTNMSLGSYFTSLKLFEELGYKRDIAMVYIGIGDVYIQLKKYHEAQDCLDKALKLSKETGNKNGIKESYGSLALLDSAMGNYKAGNIHYKMFVAYRDSLLNIESAKKILQVQMTHEFEKKETAEKNEQTKKDILAKAKANKQKIITSSIIIILLLLIAGIVLLLRQQQLRRKKDKIIFENKQLLAENQRSLAEKENALLKSEKQRMEEELESSKKILQQYTENMLEKSNMLDQFKNEIEKLTNLKSKELQEEKIEHLDYLHKAQLFTDGDWEKFKELFEQVYKGFFVRLKEKLPNLTPAETRLICLTKLRLNPKQISNMLAISTDTIKTNRYRLRKKLNLPETGECKLNCAI